MATSATILVVDDKELTLNRHVRIFEKPSKDFVAQYGDVSFIIEAARSKSGAISKLEEARKRRRPFDIALLDLNLPTYDGGKAEGPDKGIEVLQSIPPSDYTAVVIVSDYPSFGNALKAFKAGAMDFVPTPQEEDSPIWIAAMNAWERAWLQARYHESELEVEHLSWALDQTKDALASEFAGLLTRGMQGVLDGVNTLWTQLDDRYLLKAERDTGDPIILAVRSIEEAAKSTIAKGTELRMRTVCRKAEYGKVDLDSLIRNVEDRLRPALIFRHVHLAIESPGGIELETFSEDLRVIVEEMLLGSIVAHAKEGQEKPTARPWQDLHIVLARDITRRLVSLRMSDEAPSIPEETCQVINARGAIARENRRAWGLSLAQRMAHNIGAKIEAVPSATGKGTDMTLIALEYDNAPIISG